jgi:hypothetical protein
LITFFSSIQLVNSSKTTQIVGSIILVVMFVYAFYQLFFGALYRFEKRGQLASRILDKILSGELDKEDNVRKEWVLGLKEIRK